MEDERFDRIARQLAAAPSRRGAVRLLAGAAALAGGGLLARVPRPAPAQEVGIADAQCEAGPVLSDRKCRFNQCRGREDCLCAKTTGGEKRCVELLFEKTFCGRNECRRNRDCPQGELCVEIGGCCGDRRRHICVSPCG